MGFLQGERAVLALHPARPEAEPRPHARHHETALPHVAALLHRRLLGVAHADKPMAEPGWSRQKPQDERGETAHEDEAASAARGQEREHAGGEAEPGPARIAGDEAAEHDEPEREEPWAARRARQQTRQGREQREGQDARQGHVDAEGPARAVAAMVEPGRRAGVHARTRAHRDLQQSDPRGDRRDRAEQGEEPPRAADIVQGIGGHVESRHQEQALAGGQAPGKLAGQERREQRRAGKGEHRRQQGPGLRPPGPGVAEPPEPQRGEGGERRLRQRDREPEADDEGREEDAPEGVHVSRRCARTRCAPRSAR